MTEQTLPKASPIQSLSNLGFNVVIPTLILTKFGKSFGLSPVSTCLIAMAFPFCYGVLELVIKKKWNWISIIGLVSIMLTGGIGLFKISPEWLAIKEAAIPLIIAGAVLASSKTKFPFFQKMFFMMTHETKIRNAVIEKNTQSQFEKLLYQANLWFAGPFFLSAILNYGLAKYIVTSASGTEAFNTELGKMTALSFPVIALPSMIASVILVLILFKKTQTLSSLQFEEMVKT